MQKYAKFACIVSGSDANLTRYWAIASPPKHAMFAARLFLGREWILTLAKPSLKRSCLERLKLYEDEIRELSVLP
jgi:hypothetical protein